MGLLRRRGAHRGRAIAYEGIVRAELSERTAIVRDEEARMTNPIDRRRSARDDFYSTIPA